jgi:hypothetical protein
LKGLFYDFLNERPDPGDIFYQIIWDSVRAVSVKNPADLCLPRTRSEAAVFGCAYITRTSGVQPIVNPHRNIL